MIDQQQRPREGGPAAAAGPAAAGPAGVPAPDRAALRQAIRGLAGPMAMAEITGLVVLVGVVGMMARMGSQALYVRSLYLPVGSIFVAVFLAFAISMQVAAAINCGQGRPEKVWPTAISLARVWIVVAVVVIVAAVLCAPLLADAFHVTSAARGTFVSFVRWMSAAEMSQVPAWMAASCLRGYGRAAAGSAVLFAAAGLQFVGVAVLGLHAGMGTTSVPVSLAISSVISLVLGLVLMRRHGLWHAGQPRPWLPESAGFLQQIGIPVAMSQIILFLANLGLLSVLGGRFGQHVISGFSSAVSLQYLIYMPGIVLGSATAIVINQQRGAGRSAWIPATLRAGMEVTFTVYAIIAVFTWAASGALGQMLTTGTGVPAQASLYLSTIGLTYVLLGPVLASLGVMEQVGAGAVAVLLNIIYFGAIVGIGALVLHADPHPVALYRTIAACNLAGVVVVVAAVLVVRRVSRATPAGPPPLAPQDMPVPDMASTS